MIKQNVLQLGFRTMNVSLTILYKDMENFYTKAKIESNGET